MSKIQVINKKLLEKVSEQAKSGNRKRMNYNFHDDYSDPINRMLNALEPETYIQPHKHEDPDKREVFLILKGRMAVFFFDDNGAVTESVILSPDDGCYGVDIPPNTWHTLVCLESGSVAYEVKDGPYEKPKDKNFAPWAPKEGNEKAQEYLEQLIKQII